MAEVPYDQNIERGLMGLLLRRPQLVGDVIGELTPEDFYEPMLGRWYSELVGLWEEGDPKLRDPVLLPRWIAQKLDSDVDYVKEDWGRLLGHQGAADPLAAASILSDLGRRRRLQAAAGAAVERASDPRMSVEAVADELTNDVARLDRTVDRSDLLTGFDLMDDADVDPMEWVVPGFIGRQDRLVCVAPGGAGKSTLLRYFAVSALAGRNPLTGQHFPDCAPRVLIIDLENPGRVIRDGFRRMMRHAAIGVPDVPERIQVRSYPRQIDLRSRTDRAMMEGWIEDAQPDLVCMGPAYKAIHAPRQGENEQNAATALLGVMDDLRARYDFALILEHHGGKADRGAPIGTSVWEWWPEYGRGLDPLDKFGEPAKDVRFTMSLKVRAWRGDRYPIPWPDAFVRSSSSPWPFEAFWPNGHPPRFVIGQEMPSLTASDPGPSEPPPDDYEEF